MLIDAGAELDATDVADDTALHCAARDNHMDCLDLLIKAGATVDMRNAAGATALVEAINDKRQLVVDVLTTAGADANFQLHWAAQNGKQSVVRDMVMSHATPINLQVQRPAYLACNLSCTSAGLVLVNLARINVVLFGGSMGRSTPYLREIHFLSREIHFLSWGGAMYLLIETEGGVTL